jgi:hypothetical protein
VYKLCITRVDADVLASLGMADGIDELVTKRAIAFA